MEKTPRRVFFTLVIGKINIFGPIGKFENQGKLEGVNLLDVILQVKALPAETQIVEVHIAGPGGLVDEGDNIYNYLESLKKNYVVNTIQDGHIASIDTKLFLVGQNRVADPRFDFLIHNPWNDPGPGDSVHQAENLESLLMAEEQLRKFYAKALNINEEGLKPLMDQETTLNAQQLVSLGFATSLKTNIKVMAMKKNTNEPTLYERVMALGKKIKGEKAKALDVQTAQGTLSVDAPDEDSMVGAPAMLDGNPAPDGDYTTSPDGEGMSDTITVKGGMVEAVVEAPAAQLPVAKDRIENLEKVVNTLAKAVGELIDAQEKALVDALTASEQKAEARITALKNEIGTVHTPKKAATVYAEGVDKNATGFKKISDRLKEIGNKKSK